MPLELLKKPPNIDSFPDEIIARLPDAETAIVTDKKAARHKVLKSLIEQSELPILLADGLDEFKAVMANIEPGNRKQVMVRVDAHYTAFDIDKSNPGKPRVVMIDSAGDQRAFPLFFSIDKPYEKFCVGRGFGGEMSKEIQADSVSCSLFAFDHCCVLNSYSSDVLYGHLRANACRFGSIKWDSMPPAFVRNAQSVKRLKAYMETAEAREPGCLDKPMENGMSFREYINEGICSYPDLISLFVEEVVERNESINFHVLSQAIGYSTREEIIQDDVAACRQLHNP